MDDDDDIGKPGPAAVVVVGAILSALAGVVLLLKKLF